MVRILKLRLEVLKREFGLFNELEAQMTHTVGQVRDALQIVQAYRSGLQTPTSPMVSPVLCRLHLRTIAPSIIVGTNFGIGF